MDKDKKIKSFIFNEKGSFEEPNQSGEDDFFDDCPICQAMKQAKEQGKELSEKEMKEAFKKAKDAGGIVGGEWFKD